MNSGGTTSWTIFGDFSRFIIVDRIGQSIVGTIPDLDWADVPKAKDGGLYKWWKSQSGGSQP